MKKKVILHAIVLTSVMAISVFLARDWLLSQAQAWITAVRVAEIERAAALSQQFHEDAQILARELAAHRKLTAAQVHALITSSDPDQTLQRLRHWAGDEALGESLPRLLAQLEEHQRVEERITRLGKLYLTIREIRRKL
jgi:hypothetical protein